MGLRVGKPRFRLSAYTNEDSDGNAMLKSHAYKAVTEGFVSVKITSTETAGSYTVYVGITDDPVGAGEIVQILEPWIPSGGHNYSMFFAVAKDEYFEVIGRDTVEILWKSVGTLSKPIDFN